MIAVWQAALAAREAGLANIPVRVNKKPAEGGKRSQQEGTSPSQVEAWFLTRTQRGLRYWLGWFFALVALSEAA